MPSTLESLEVVSVALYFTRNRRLKYKETTVDYSPSMQYTDLALLPSMM